VVSIDRVNDCCQLFEGRLVLFILQSDLQLLDRDITVVVEVDLSEEDS
jgi:hypothetical protein